MADRKKCKAAADATTDGGGEDRISALPDEVLQHALSFLPSLDAARTCVLSRCWRHQWKSVSALRISVFRGCRGAQHLSDFVANFMLGRNRLALDECDISCFDEGDSSQAFRENVRQWIHYAVSCQVRVLRVSVEEHILLFGAPLKAQHLKRLGLWNVELGASSLDFSSCRELEELEMGRCIINDNVKILSKSLRHLRIEGCDFSERALVFLAQISFPWRLPSLACTLKCSRACLSWHRHLSGLVNTVLILVTATIAANVVPVILDAITVQLRAMAVCFSMVSQMPSI